MVISTSPVRSDSLRLGVQRLEKEGANTAFDMSTKELQLQDAKILPYTQAGKQILLSLQTIGLMKHLPVDDDGKTVNLLSM